MQNIIVANFSLHSIALIKWAKDNLSSNFCVLSVDTGFQADGWDDYLKKVFLWLNEENITHYHLKPDNNFNTLVKARKHFPSQQFSWCAGFLKGITLLDKIDELDPDCEATILLAHRKDMSKASTLLKEHNEEVERYDYRNTWYPLLNKTHYEIINLTDDLVFCHDIEHSLECQPCIHSTTKQLKLISPKDIEKVSSLEHETETYMFNNQPFQSIINFKDFDKSNILEELSKACSWEYSCGI